MKTLFPETDIIQTINFDQHEIIENILELHSPWGIDVDPTYCRGGFYRRIPRPKYCFDINPAGPEIQKADCRQLPLPRGSIRSIMFDPPFMATTHKNGNMGLMAGRYSYVDTMEDLHSLYLDSLKEFWRILLPAGRLIFKCQDAVNSRINHFTHVWVMNEAEKLGFRAIDLFVKLNKSAPRAWNHNRQFFARKLHSYFWVFKKSGRRRFDEKP